MSENQQAAIRSVAKRFLRFTASMFAADAIARTAVMGGPAILKAAATPTTRPVLPVITQESSAWAGITRAGKLWSSQATQKAPYVRDAIGRTWADKVIPQQRRIGQRQNAAFERLFSRVF
ncbi:MAG: hypothetical protein VKJ06_06775 [Vampirovibrionales bacterium]|nr:hypothetical protein [Vampirovibrionales bacterium]